MSDCGCHASEVENAVQRRTIGIALLLNATMFVVGGIAGIVAQSSGLLADALDMFADASAYAIALLAVGRSQLFKRRAALTSGLVLAVLGAGVIIDAIRRALTGGEPEGWIMFAVATLSLLVNATVLRLLNRYRHGEVHLRASWIFTRADVIANVGVILAGGLVLWTHSRIPDLVIGCGIGFYVLKEAGEIPFDLRSERDALREIDG